MNSYDSAHLGTENRMHPANQSGAPIEPQNNGTEYGRTVRAVATITVYVYGDNDRELLEQAQRIERLINQDSPSADANTESFHLAEFGSMDRPEIDMSGLVG